MFQQLDTDKDGKISLTEFRGVFSDRDLELPANLRRDASLQEELFKHGADKDGAVNLGQFKGLWTEIQKQVEDENKEQGLLPLEPLDAGKRVLKSGVLELKKEWRTANPTAEKGRERKKQNQPRARSEGRPHSRSGLVERSTCSIV